jgi:hypothetical protein
VRLTALVLLAGFAASACTNQLSVVLASDAAAPDAITLAPGDVELTSAQSSTSSSSTTSTSTTTTTAPPDPITLGFVGDVQMIGSMVANEPVAGVTDLLSAPDLTLVNLETVIGEVNEVGRPPIDKEFIFRSPPETLKQLVDAGVDVVALANNHGWDYGPLGSRVPCDWSRNPRAERPRLPGVATGLRSLPLVRSRRPMRDRITRS